MWIAARHDLLRLCRSGLQDAPTLLTGTFYSRANIARHPTACHPTGRAIFFDEEKVVWRKGDAAATRELLRSIAIATTMFEFVVVMNVTAQTEIHSLRGQLMSGRKIIVSPRIRIGRISPRRTLDRRLRLLVPTLRTIDVGGPAYLGRRCPSPNRARLLPKAQSKAYGSFAAVCVHEPRTTIVTILN